MEDLKQGGDMMRFSFWRDPLWLHANQWAIVVECGSREHGWRPCEAGEEEERRNGFETCPGVELSPDQQAARS